jgi:ribosomal protein S13
VKNTVAKQFVPTDLTGREGMIQRVQKVKTQEQYDDLSQQGKSEYDASVSALNVALLDIIARSSGRMGVYDAPALFRQMYGVDRVFGVNAFEEPVKQPGEAPTEKTGTLTQTMSEAGTPQAALAVSGILGVGASIANKIAGFAGADPPDKELVLFEDQVKRLNALTRELFEQREAGFLAASPVELDDTILLPETALGRVTLTASGIENRILNTLKILESRRQKAENIQNTQSQFYKADQVYNAQQYLKNIDPVIQEWKSLYNTLYPRTNAFEAIRQ